MICLHLQHLHHISLSDWENDSEDPEGRKKGEVRGFVDLKGIVSEGARKGGLKIARSVCGKSRGGVTDRFIAPSFGVHRNFTLVEKEENGTKRRKGTSSIFPTHLSPCHPLSPPPFNFLLPLEA